MYSMVKVTISRVPVLFYMIKRTPTISAHTPNSKRPSLSKSLVLFYMIKTTLP